MTAPKLVFPELAEDLGDAFNNAIETGVMQRVKHDTPDFWMRFELIASDWQDGAIVADWFVQTDYRAFHHVPRKEKP